MDAERQLVRLSEVEEKPLEWVWPGFIPAGTLTNFSGDPAQGKSRVAYDLTSRITTGQPMPGCTEPSAPAGVVLLQGEDAVGSMVKPTLASVGADLTKVSVHDPKQFAGQPLSLPNDLDVIEHAVALVNAKLVVVDPVSVFIDCNANNELSVRKALKPLAEFAENEGLGILLVRHLSKANAGNPLYQATGSIAWTAAARSEIRAINDPTSSDQHRHVLVQIKTNLNSAPSLSYRTVLVGEHVGVEWLGTSGITVKDLVRGQGEDGTKLWEGLVPDFEA